MSLRNYSLTNKKHARPRYHTFLTLAMDRILYLITSKFFHLKKIHHFPEFLIDKSPLRQNGNFLETINVLHQKAFIKAFMRVPLTMVVN